MKTIWWDGTIKHNGCYFASISFPWRDCYNLMAKRNQSFEFNLTLGKEKSQYPLLFFMYITRLSCLLCGFCSSFCLFLVFINAVHFQCEYIKKKKMKKKKTNKTNIKYINEQKIKKETSEYFLAHLCQPNTIMFILVIWSNTNKLNNMFN